MNLPEKPTTGVKIKPWLKQLYYYCKSLQLRGDGRTCAITRNASGTTISILPTDRPEMPSQLANNVAGESYSGFFKAVGNVDNTDSENPVFKVKVFDGAVGEESTDSGPALINNQRKTVAAAEVEVSFGINYIFMTAGISGGVISTPVISNYSSFNGPSLDGACAVLIATAYVFAGEVQVHQQQHGAITAFIFGDCDDE